MFTNSDHFYTKTELFFILKPKFWPFFGRILTNFDIFFIKTEKIEIWSFKKQNLDKILL